ncbi:germ cell-specific gene 1-like protein [Denticeps clupeoides]|uniref:Germ cell-specific gene 1-like protein n=1 Tax=Denticeps clupeoides TaxID=299321 RepID=A0AAY4BZF3_9TELE|nr:germ cell-specific gene 1-like protein [Denticeps clupeoides]
MGIERGRRACLAITLNFVAFALAVSAVTTSYWCEGTRKVVKPFCTGPAKIKQTYCIRFNSSNLNDTRLVQYIYETGEEKFLMRKFHTGIWFSCEQAVNMIGFDCRNFLDIAPEHERGVLWLCIVAECLYISLLFVGGTLMVTEMFHCCNMMDRLKMNAFAAVCTALSGLLGMLAHMMFTTAFQLAVSIGPEDWKPKTWDYSWSYLLAWASFATCMGSAVTALNRYTKTIIEFKFKRKYIEKNLRIKQKLLELDLPDPAWDMYLTSMPDPLNQLVDFPANGFTPPYRPTSLLDRHTGPANPGEEYC